MLPTEKHTDAITDFLAERQGEAVRLRLATVADSAFLLTLRLDPMRNQNISATSGSLADQLKWMESYLERYQKGAEAYFVIETDEGPQGSLRLYDYQPQQDSFCWGSWIIRPGAPLTVAPSSVVLTYDLGFDALQFERSHFDVRKANVSVRMFHERMGARLVREDADNRYYTYDKTDYTIARARMAKLTARK